MLATANGPVKVDKAVQLQIGPLLEHIEALVLESTPLVLNVGNRCKRQGYGFHWNPFSDEPYFDLPNGRGKIILREEDGCAFLDDVDPIAGGMCAGFACPAPEGNADPGNEASTGATGSASRKVRGCVENELKRIAGTLEHMMMHEPKNPYCSVCNKAKTQRKPKFEER